MSYAERNIVLMLRSGLSAEQVAYAVERGEHLRWARGSRVIRSLRGGNVLRLAVQRGRAS